MKKLVLMILALVLLGAWPATAATTDELSMLAQYLPADTQLYGAVRSDDGFLDTLDSLLEQIADNSLLIPRDFSIRDVLDDAVGGGDDGSFEEALGPWLGDFAALSVTDWTALISGQRDDAGNEPWILAFDVADRDAAEAFLDGITDGDKLEVEDGVLYAASDEDFAAFTPNYYLTDDVMLVRPTGVDPLSIVPAPGETLADEADFAEGLERLPADDYNLMAYVDVADLLSIEEAALIEQALADQNLPIDIDIDIAAALQAVGPQTIGLTILEERSLVIDLAASVRDAEALAAAGISLNNTGSSLNLGLLENLSANTALVLQDGNFGPTFLRQLDRLKAIGDEADAEIEAGGLEPDPDSTDFFEERNRIAQLQAVALADDAVTFLELAFQGTSGISLEDALGWMTDDYISYLNVLVEPGQLPVVDFGALVAITDEDAADTFMEAVPLFLREIALTFTEDENGVTITDVADVVQEPDYAIQVTQREDFIGFGNLLSVDDDSERLSESAVYETASAVFLPDTQVLAFLNVAPFIDLSDTLADFDIDEAAILEQLLPVLESASITANYNEVGTSGVVRFALTLSPAEE